MKLRLTALLSLLATPLLFAQVRNDSTTVPKDSVKITPFIINDEKPAKKSKKTKQPDSTSYAKEYNRNNVGFQWGARGGVSFNSFNTKEVNVARVSATGTPLLVNGRSVRDQMRSNSDMVTGYLGSIFVRVTRGSYYFQPEISYARKGGRFDILQSDGKLFKRVNATYSSIDLPLLLGIRFRQGRIFAGPLFQFPLGMNDELESVLRTYTINDVGKEFFKRPAVGISAGIGFEFNHFFIEGRFESFGSPVEYSIGPNNDPTKLQISSRSLVLAIGLIK